MTITRDMALQELARRELARRQAQTSAPEESSASKVGSFLKDKFLNDQNTTGGIPNRTINAARDLAGGVMKGAQSFGALLGEGGEALAGILTGGYAPKVDIREEMGLGKDRPVDLGGMIASKNPSSLAMGAGQFAPAIIAGGASLPGQIASTGLWGAVQASPDQKNFGGLLPRGRIGGGLADAITTGAAGKVGEEVLSGLPMIRNMGAKIMNKADYLRPNKAAKEFLQTLSTGTKEENLQSLAQDIQNAHQQRLQDALSHKTPIYEQEAGLDLYQTPESALPEGNLEKVAHYVAPGDKYSPDQLQQLAKEIKNYRKNNNFEDFTDNVGDIFNTDLNEKQIGNLQNALDIPTQASATFKKLAEKNVNVIQGNTKELFDKFNIKPTLKNADALQSQLGDDWAYYENLRKQGKLEPALKPIMQKTKELRDALKDDMQNALNRKNPQYGEEIAKFNKKYSENVAPYGEENFTQNIVGEGKKIREQRAQDSSIPFSVTPNEANTFFANPTREAIKVANDIGTEGQNKILYNLLANEVNPSAGGLAKSILDARQSGGYSRYITPEMIDFANELIKREKIRNGLNYVATGGLAGLGLGGGYGIYRKFS